MNLPIVNPHIEKTAGSSMRHMLIEAVGESQVLMYDPRYDALMQADDCITDPTNRLLRKAREVLKHTLEGNSQTYSPTLTALRSIVRRVEYRNALDFEDIPSDFTGAVTGHFQAGRMNGVVSPSEGSYITLLREPLKRMRSQFDHWRRSKGHDLFRIAIPYNDAMSFEEFALLPVLQNYQFQAFNGVDPSEFHTIGLTERFDDFKEELGLAHKSPLVNVAPNRPDTAYRSGFLNIFEEFHSDDYALYEQVRSRWQ